LKNQNQKSCKRNPEPLLLKK